ncbi:MAG TPA: alcohol dehydrogenase catalytic domain-containing protein [Nitrospinota bacterium]|nr:alcohol dehydrogenase catalytic domain-containing protein [Nitrospinota bacterium]
MRAQVLHEFGGPLRMEERPLPEPGRGEALLRVRACAVDQFDLTIRDGKWPGAKLPLILGHEVAGEVEAVGLGAEGVSIGDRAASTLYLTCGACKFCRTGRETLCLNFGGHLGAETDGGFAECMALPADMLVRVADHISFEAASILANACGTPYHAVKVRAEVQPGETVVVVGAGGGVGIHAVQIARVCGAQVFGVELAGEKLDGVREIGTDAALSADSDWAAEVLERTDGAGAEKIIQLVGGETYGPSFRCLAVGGRMVIIGSHAGTDLGVSGVDILAKEWEILGSRNVTKQELAEVADLAARGEIRPVVSRTFAFEDLEEAHRLLREGKIAGRGVVRI